MEIEVNCKSTSELVDYQIINNKFSGFTFITSI